MNNKLNKFSYIAKDTNGKRVRGTFIAEDEQFVREELSKNNLFVVKIKKVSAKAPSAFFSISGKVSTKEITNFCKQFSVLISSGISIIDAILTLKEQPYSALLKKTLEKVVDDLYAGMMLSESFKKYPKVFPDFLASMIFVGESSGKLPQVLLSVSSYYTRTQKNKQKLRSALAYPLILFFMMLAVTVVMMHFVIPRFIDTFMQMEIDMPILTLALFNISQFFRDYWKYLLLGLLLIIILIYASLKTKKGKYFFDACKVKLPIFKKITYAIFTAQFVESLGLLLSSGLDIVSCLDNVRVIIKNEYLAKQFDKVIIDVKKGISLSSAIEIEMQLGTVVTQMIAVGEKTGATDKMLLQTVEYFDGQVENALGLITTTVQPILLSIMGIFIAILFVAIYAPILSMITTLT